MKMIAKDKQFIEQSLTTFLKKCPNIKKAIIGKDMALEVLSLIGQYCPNIKSLDYCGSIGSDDNVLPFFRHYGHKLEEVFIEEEGNKHIKQCLKFCPNLKKVDVLNISINYHFLPKLEHIFSDLSIDSKDVNKMKILSNKYSKTLKTLDVTLNALTEEEVKTCIDYICRFENLQSLTLGFSALKVKEPIEKSLKLIGQKCIKLLKLDLDIDHCLRVTDRFFETFSEFKAIKKLKIELFSLSIKAVKGSIESMKECKQLNELDLRYCYLREDFFANVATFVPNLRSLRVETEKKFSNKFDKSFHSMKNIEKVKIFIDDYHNERTEKKFWYFGKKLFEVMSSAKGRDVKRVNDNCGLIACDYTENQAFEDFEDFEDLVDLEAYEDFLYEISD